MSRSELRLRRRAMVERLEERALRITAICDVAYWLFLIGCGALGAYGALVGVK